MARVDKDVVCGMALDADTILASVEYEGEAYAFCSEDCGNRFLSEPQRYSGVKQTAKEPLRLERHEPPYTKWGPIVAPKFGAAGSGGAEYERLPEMHDDADEEERGKRKGREH